MVSVSYVRYAKIKTLSNWATPKQGEKMAGEHVFNVSDNDFQAQVLDSDVPVLVDFWATWCAPCKAIAPVLDSIADEFGGKFKVAKVDIDSNRDAARRYNVRSIPTLVMVKNGEVVAQVTGALPRPRLVEMINKAM